MSETVGSVRTLPEDIQSAVALERLWNERPKTGDSLLVDLKEKKAWKFGSGFVLSKRISHEYLLGNTFSGAIVVTPTVAPGQRGELADALVRVIPRLKQGSPIIVVEDLGNSLMNYEARINERRDFLRLLGLGVIDFSPKPGKDVLIWKGRVSKVPKEEDLRLGPFLRRILKEAAPKQT